MTGTSLSEFTTTFNQDEISMGYMRYNGRAIFVHYIPEQESDRSRAYSLVHAKKCTQQFFPLISAKITLESLQQFDSNFVKDTLASCDPLKGKKSAGTDVRFTIMANNQGLNELLNMSESNKEFAQLLEKKEMLKQSAEAEAHTIKTRDISSSVVKEREISTSVVAPSERDSLKVDVQAKSRESNSNASTRDSESKTKEISKKTSNTDVSSIKYPNFQTISKGSLGSLSSKSSANNSAEKMNNAHSEVDDTEDHKSMHVFWDEMKNKLAMETAQPESNRLKNFVTKSAAHAQNIFGRSVSSESLKVSKAANAVIAQHKQKQTGGVPNELIKFPKSSPLNSLSKATGNTQSLPNLIEISVEPPSPSKDPKGVPIVYDNDQARLRRHSADKQMIFRNEDPPKVKPANPSMPFKAHRNVGKSLEDINIDDLLKTPPNADFPDSDQSLDKSATSPGLRRTKTESTKKTNDFFRETKKLPELPMKTIDSIISGSSQSPPVNISPVETKRKVSATSQHTNDEILDSKPTVTKSLLASKTITSSSREKLLVKEELSESREKVMVSEEKLLPSAESNVNQSIENAGTSQEKPDKPNSGLNSKTGSRENLRAITSKERLNLSNSNLPGKLSTESPKEELRRTPTLPKNTDVVFNIHKGGQLRGKNEVSSSPSSPTPPLTDKSKTVKNRQIQLHEQWVQYQAPLSDTVVKRWIRLQKGYLALFLDDKEVSPLLHISLDQPSDLVDCAYGKYPGICLQSSEGDYRFYSMDEKNTLKRILILARKWA
ncbi:hypothetical protein HDV06_006274 [Boothiomyces sp. JEL0866]|nr:hypothetical protein HDV06_006731 [Boothiomyces sp. JEL0866]KAJ3319464.1 hypothetical protein HDV06_006274 [Boothiomyces sp. JEL0866]